VRKFAWWHPVSAIGGSARYYDLCNAQDSTVFPSDICVAVESASVLGHLALMRSAYSMMTGRLYPASLRAIGPNRRDPLSCHRAADFRNSPGAINEIPQLMDR
jgi:hypothetical protein